MSKESRRRFTPEFKERAVARLSAPGATQSSVAKELGVTPTQLKTWRLELEAAGSAAAVRRGQAEATALSDLRRENRRLKEELEVMRKASAFFAQWAAKTVRPRTPSVR
ncbi:MAG: transposase, partial [Pseudomonadota bacterium]